MDRGKLTLMGLLIALSSVFAGGFLAILAGAIVLGLIEIWRWFRR